MDLDEIFPERKGSIVPKVDEAESSGTTTPKSKLLAILDEIEDRVENFRKAALYMEEERDYIFTSIDSIRTSDLVNDLIECEREDINNYMDRVSSRCATVEVAVRTERNDLQDESLSQVNTYINNLIMDLKADPFSVKTRCLSYMAACSTKGDDVFDKNFESALLGCSLDDQKRIRRRLHGLLNYIDCIHDITNCSDK